MEEVTLSQLYSAVANAENKIKNTLDKLESEFDKKLSFDIVVEKLQYSGESPKNNVRIEVKLVRQ